MQTVHPLLLGPPEDISSLKIMLFLQQLGVKKLTPYEVIQHHILPALKSPDAEANYFYIYILILKAHINIHLHFDHLPESFLLNTAHKNFAEY